MSDTVAPSGRPAQSTSTMARTARGAGWTICWRLCNRGVGIISTLILVRLLTPEDFGLVSLAIGFFQSLDQIAGFGAEGAIIRANRADPAIFDAGFTLNVSRGAVTSLLLAAAATPLARFFGNPHLQEIVYVLAACWMVSSFQNIGIVAFRRELAFDKEFKLQMMSRLTGTLVTIATAFAFRTYWCLVAGLCANMLASVALSYAMHPYRPRFGVAGMGYIFGFSFWEWLIGILNMVAQRSDPLVIGRLMGAASVGVYGVGAEVSALSSSEIVGPLCRALFSGFVAEKQSGKDGTDMMLRTFAMLAAITFPISVGLSLVAGPLLLLAFGSQWLGAVPLVRIAGIASAVVLFSNISEALFSANAWLKSILWASLCTTVLRVLLMVVAVARLGLPGAVLAASAASVFQEGIYILIARRRLRFRLRALLKCVIRPAIAVSVMAGVLYGLGLGWNMPAITAGRGAVLAELVGAAGAGAITYVATLSFLWILAGRPPGGEADLFLAATKAVRRLQFA